MAIFRCKMCGGDLVITPNSTVCECEYCGSKQTIPVADDEKKIKLYERANKLRYNCDFDKAAGVYENIIADFPDEAEAYWGLLLCKFGIEYVDSPDGRKVPTCHRSSFDSVMDDPDFEMVMENADSAACDVYRAQAKQIEEIRKGIIEVSGREEPYDIFICYKETAEDGQRTLDSVLAQDIYDALTAKGYRVFFSRVTLEDKLGTEYEPYIFAALNSAKLMLAFGTSYQYYNAVWVKNEWSRYLKLMALDKSKHLIPCYKGIDAYDIPKEFVKLQAQDLGKVGATQDLLRGIEKILGKKQEAAPVYVVRNAGPDAETFLKRGFLFAEDGEWQQADGYCEKALELEPENGKAYLLKLLLEFRVPTIEALADCDRMFYQSSNYKKCLRFAASDLAEKVKALGEEWQEKRNARIQKNIEAKEEEISAIRAQWQALEKPGDGGKSAKRRLIGWACIVAGFLLTGLVSESAPGAAMLTLPLIGIGIILLAMNRTSAMADAEKIKQLKSEEQRKRDELDIYKQDAAAEDYSTPSTSSPSTETYKAQTVVARPRKTGERQQAMTYAERAKAYRQALVRMESVPEIEAAIRAAEKIEEVEKQFGELSIFNRKDKKRLQEQLETLRSDREQCEQQAAEGMREISRFYFGEVLPVFRLNVNDCVNLINMYVGNTRSCLFRNEATGKEPAANRTWDCLHRDDKTMLLLCTDKVGMTTYSSHKKEWSASFVRAWLNETFKNSAFTGVQLKVIEDGEVFLLSDTEAEEYFGRKQDRCLKPGIDWWLRTEGHNRKKAAFVTAEGKVNSSGKPKEETAAVRPAIRIVL